eukprot:CAMPEP_0119142300 /NCGR_PEP_ID=MMETSP1310-20130426/32400_1 /TAXON_ID=464262 /ORGANISM="Genus nov. species nov., Strain RCC2339" /LENGTH=47 /DNA_ID= /DNA_START= /DNA_END= /DNA_ORIENTATION=
MSACLKILLKSMPVGIPASRALCREDTCSVTASSPTRPRRSAMTAET